MFARRTDILSEVMVYDLASARARVLLQSAGRYEAANWLPDNSALLINGQGRLWRVSLTAPGLEPVETGFAQKLNNDHGPSPDGSLLALSDKSETGQSVIYTMPMAGGTPRRLSAEGSYFHAWAPDGARLAYTARRGGLFRIATCAADGQDERVLTDDAFDHCDGPDYTPDGRWIWFNGERDGAVDLWRVPSEGGRPERMTQDRSVNWFPHPSPDGAWVVFLAYGQGTQQHPPDRHVTLRLIPAEGGRPRILCALWGGQGTLNVPSWSPDGSKFAFLRYRVAPGAPVPGPQ